MSVGNSFNRREFRAGLGSAAWYWQKRTIKDSGKWYAKLAETYLLT